MVTSAKVLDLTIRDFLSFFIELELINQSISDFSMTRILIHGPSLPPDGWEGCPSMVR